MSRCANSEVVSLVLPGLQLDQFGCLGAGKLQSLRRGCVQLLEVDANQANSQAASFTLTLKLKPLRLSSDCQTCMTLAGAILHLVQLRTLKTHESEPTRPSSNE
eukprot:5778606-Amphidinium_carterae.2